jgi:hypothetical protein
MSDLSAPAGTIDRVTDDLTVRIRGVEVRVEDFPRLREAVEALHGLAMSPYIGQPTKLHLEAMRFFEMAAESDYPTSPPDYPQVLGEIDAAINSHK